MKDEERGSLLLRLPSTLKEKMRELARENRRSMTQEIVVAIEQRLSGVRTDGARSTQC
jgi:predicted transcriptional regulator